MKCHTCGQENDGKKAYCTSCGSNLHTTSDSRAHRRSVTEGVDIKKGKGGRSIRWVGFLILVGAIIACFGGLVGYKKIEQTYSPEVVISDFSQALMQKDRDILRELIQPTDSRIKVNEQSLDALFMLLERNPSLLTEIEEGLRDEALSNPLFMVKETGKKYLLFHEYKIDATGYYVAIKAGDGTVVSINENEMGHINEANQVIENGPFLPGMYTVRGEGDEQVEEKTLELYGAQQKVGVTLETGTPFEEKEEGKKKEEEPKEVEVKEKTVIKEVVREVPPQSTYGYYILPTSHLQHLTYSDIAGLTKRELRIARNEIYARHGYVFKSEELRNYFSNQSWYRPNAGYTGELSSVEESNVQFIKSYE